MESGGKELYPKPPLESEKRHFSKYGKRPRGDLLGRKSKERTYFDSGDFALSTAHKVTDNGAVQTGRAHPHRDNISHPYAPVPGASNVDKDANEDLYRKSATPEESPLHQQANIEGQDPTNKEEQAKPSSHED